MTTERKKLYGQPEQATTPTTEKGIDGETALAATRVAGIAQNVVNNATDKPSTFNGTKPNSETTSFVNGSDLLSNFNPVPNPMGELYQPTYHFKFGLGSDLSGSENKGKFIIAETGLTGMNIQDVLIESFVGPNLRTKNATATNITIKIYEPFGAMLPDLLYQAAVDMKIRNYLKAPWTLELKLHGYDENGVPQNVGPGWTWKMVLIDVKTQIKESGSDHTITAMPLSEVALNNQYCMLSDVSKVESATTVGDALKSIIESMNTSITDRYGATTPPLVEYVVEERPYPYDTKVGVTTPFAHPITASAPQDGNQTSNDTYAGESAHFSTGTDFPSMVDMIFAKSETAVKMLRISRELPPEGKLDEELVVKDVRNILHRIDTKVEYLGYNPVVGDYCKKITYIIKPYDSLRILSSMGRAQNFDKGNSLNRAKAAHAIDQHYMVKQYDYIFTGMNTEVLKFDIDVNFIWSTSVPKMQGMFFTGTPGRVDDLTESKQLLAGLQATRGEIDAKNAELAKLDSDRDAANGDESSENATKRKKLMEEKKALESRAELMNAASTEATNKVLEAERAKEDEDRKSLPTGDIVDGEDLVYERTQGNDYAGAGQDKLSYLPMTISQDSSNPQLLAINGTANDNSSIKSVYGALLNQAYGNFDSNLISIDLDIKGDPYWLGPGNSGEVFDEKSTREMPNFQNGEHMFVFRFKLPQGYDETTGRVSVAKDNIDPATGKSKSYGGNSNIFTGFYATTTITNRFVEGRFTQRLSAVRIPGWDYENILDGRDSIADDGTTFDNSPGPSSPAVSAPTANNGGSSSSGSGTGNKAKGKTLPRGSNPGAKTRGLRNNNPGNLEDGPFTRRQPGYIGTDGRFAVYDTLENGIKAHETLIRHNYVNKPTTVRAVVSRYAPPKEAANRASHENYIRFVTQKIGKSNVTAADTKALAKAMRQFESGPGTP